jgi:hypothetical protein
MPESGRPVPAATLLSFALLLLAAASGAAADGTTPAPFHCPASGPNGGFAPQAMAKSAGTIVLLCADLDPSDGSGQLTSSAAVFDSGAAGPPQPIWSATDPAGRFRIQAVPDRGFSVTTEALLPRDGRPYEWTAVTSFDVRCENGACGRQASQCALALSASERRDLFGSVRQAARGTPEASVVQRLVDDLTVQALLGDDVAAWILADLDAIVHLDAGLREVLTSARAVLDQARDAGCEAFRPWQEPPPVPIDLQALAARVRTPREQAESPGPALPPERLPKPEGAADSSSVQSLDAVAWLVGGTWAGHGKLPDGRTVQAEESYHWGPGRQSIRFTAKTSGGGLTGAKADGVIFFENKAGKVVLWNVRPQGGLSESILVRADPGGCVFQGSDGRSVLTHNGRDRISRTVEQLQGTTWSMLVSLQLERRTS